MPLSLSNSVLPSTLLKNFVLMRLCFMRGYLFGKTGFLQDTKKSMGDNLVHALGPEKTRIERQVTPTLKAQTFTTCSNSIQRNFSGFRALPNK